PLSTTLCPYTTLFRSPKYPWAATLYGDKGMLRVSVNDFDFYPAGRNEPTLSGKPLLEEDKYPEDRTEKDLERHVASAVRVHMQRSEEHTSELQSPDHL